MSAQEFENRAGNTASHLCLKEDLGLRVPPLGHTGVGAGPTSPRLCRAAPPSGSHLQLSRLGLGLVPAQSGVSGAPSWLWHIAQGGAVCGGCSPGLMGVLWWGLSMAPCPCGHARPGLEPLQGILGHLGRDGHTVRLKHRCACTFCDSSCPCLQRGSLLWESRLRWPASAAPHADGRSRALGREPQSP